MGVESTTGSFPKDTPAHLLPGAVMYGPWDRQLLRFQHKSDHISFGEAFCTAAAVAAHGPRLAGKTVVFVSDNQNTVSAINRLTCKDRRLAGIVRGLATMAWQHNIFYQAVHRRGVNNILCDYASRCEYHQFRPSPVAFGDFLASHPVEWEAYFNDSSTARYPPLLTPRSFHLVPSYAVKIDQTTSSVSWSGNWTSTPPPSKPATWP